MKSILFFLLAFSLFLGCNTTNKSIEEQDQYVIMISLDGFSSKYAKKYNATNLLSLAKEGVFSAGMIPPYPSKTFPSHYTIATGLYPEHHGIVGNTFYDPKLKKKYSTSNRTAVEDGKWYNGTPIWCLAQKNNIKTASYFWIGSEAEIDNCRPNYYYNYDKSIPDINRLDKAIEWLELPKSERPQLISLYFSLIDDKGHKFGPNSKEIEKAVLEIDEKLGDFFKKLDQLHLPINVIITSDHGMYPLDQSKKIIREDILDWSKIASIPEDAFALIYTKNSFETDSLFTILKSKEKGRYSTYKKNDIPTKLHYKNNDRIGDIVVIANTPYFFTSKKYNDYWGAHGFDPYTNPEMHGIFYANGPAFKAHQEIQSFESIHVYPLIANILQLPYDSLSIDGKPHVLNHLLKD